MNRLVIDRSDTVGIVIDSNGEPTPKPQNWMVLVDDNFNSIPFIKEYLDIGFERIEFKPIKFSHGNIVAYRADGFKWVIGYWKQI